MFVDFVKKKKCLMNKCNLRIAVSMSFVINKLPNMEFIKKYSKF